MVEIVLGVVGIGGAIGLAVLQVRARLQAWKKAAIACGLQVVQASSFSGLTAQAGPLSVHMKAVGDKNKRTRIVVTVDGPREVHDVSIRPESLISWGQEIEVGDPSFDAAFFIEGPAQTVFALLDEETRHQLLYMKSECRLVEISRSVLRADMPHRKVSKILPHLVKVGNRFAQPLEAPRRLAENTHRDTAAGVRLQNLLVLVRELPAHAQTVMALHMACSDSSPEIRLHAAKELGEDGRSVLLELAEAMEDDAVGAEAVSILEERGLPFERTKAILAQALSSRRTQTAHACMKALGRSGVSAAVDVLSEVMAQEKGELAIAAAQALGTLGDPAAEPSLILALQREHADVRVAAANALGRVGSVEAVLPLKEATERSWLDREFHQAARQAIAEIQSRLQGASPGQLSLAQGEAGQLSLAQAEGGELSLANDAAGQLSLGDTEET